MKAFLRTQLPLIAIALLAAGGLYWFWFQEDPFASHKNASNDDAKRIDFYVENAKSHRFMADGTLDYQLQAARLAHFQASDITEVTKPDMQLYRGNAAHPWHINSERAQVAAGGKHIDLFDDVQLVRRNEAGQAMRLTSQTLSVFPDRQYASTTDSVRIETTTGVTTAVGMEAFFKEQHSRVLLHSKVRGQHEIR